MANLYSFHREESRKTAELIALINSFHLKPTDVQIGQLNSFTLLWALLKEANYEALTACKTGVQLKKLLQEKPLSLLKGKGNEMTLHLGNYIHLKSILNEFYRYLLSVSTFFVHNRIFIDKQKVLRALKGKDFSFATLLRQDRFVFKLQRLVTLPKVNVKGAYETHRSDMSFEDKKSLDAFVGFITQEVSDARESLRYVKGRLQSFGRFVERRKSVVIGLLVLALLPFLSTSLPGTIFQASLLSNQTSSSVQPLLIQVYHDPVTFQDYLDIINPTERVVTVHQIFILGKQGTQALVTSPVDLPPQTIRTFPLPVPAIASGALIRITTVDAQGNSFIIDQAW